MDLLKTENHNVDEVITQLVEKYGQDLLHLTYSYVWNNEVAKDLTQEIFIKCFESLHIYKGAASVRTWLWCIAKNHCKDYLRSWHFRHVSSWESNPNSLELNIISVEIDEGVIRKEENKILAAAVLLLPKKYREVIYLYYFQEQSLAEIGSILNVKLNTIKTRLRKAKQLLKKEWEAISKGKNQRIYGIQSQKHF